MYPLNFPDDTPGTPAQSFPQCLFGRTPPRSYPQCAPQHNGGSAAEASPSYRCRQSRRSDTFLSGPRPPANRTAPPPAQRSGQGTGGCLAADCYAQSEKLLHCAFVPAGGSEPPTVRSSCSFHCAGRPLQGRPSPHPRRHTVSAMTADIRPEKVCPGSRIGCSTQNLRRTRRSVF